MELDGMVERLNTTIKDMLSKYINVRQTDWDDFIDCVVMAHNSSVHETLPNDVWFRDDYPWIYKQNRWRSEKEKKK